LDDEDDDEPVVNPLDPDAPPRKRIKTVEKLELEKKYFETYPVVLGLIMSTLSLLLSSLLVQLYEPEWSFFDANYYFVTSFLTIGKCWTHDTPSHVQGLGDITPSAPEHGDEMTLIPHILLLFFSITFIGMCQHVVSRRVELAYVNIGYNIHMEFRTRQVGFTVYSYSMRTRPRLNRTFVR
jgi:hypothetical protein